MPGWRRISPSYRPRAAPSSSGWKDGRCPELPHCNADLSCNSSTIDEQAFKRSPSIVPLHSVRCELIVRPLTARRGNSTGIAMNHSEMTAKIELGDGFIAALDQSGGSTPKALNGYGIGEGAWSSDEEMFGLIHQMRQRIIASPCFGSGKVLGAILFERTMDGMVNGKPTPQALIDQGVVPFIKIDKGLEAEENGVQMMKPMPDLDTLLERAKGLGVFGTKERSVINFANRDGIAAVVRQQFEVARQVIGHGMMPIIEPEVNINSPA